MSVDLRPRIQLEWQNPGSTAINYVSWQHEAQAPSKGEYVIVPTGERLVVASVEWTFTGYCKIRLEVDDD